MKKLSVLIALALVLTIGGAYATWTYVVGDIADVSATTDVGMGTKVEVTSTAFGKFTYTNDLAFKVEPKTTTGDFTTTLVAKKADGDNDDANDVVSGNLVITFTADPNAPDTYKDNATPTTVTISLVGFTQYDDGTGAKDLITIGSAITIGAPGSSADIEWDDQGNGVFTAEITPAIVMSRITLTEFVLDTPAKYTEYAGKLGDLQFTISAD